MTQPEIQSGTFGRPDALDDAPAFVRDMVADMRRNTEDDWRRFGGWIVVRCWLDQNNYTLTVARIVSEYEGTTR